MLCLEDDSWAADILFLSETDAFGRRPMMEATTRKRYGKYHSIYWKENTETDLRKGIHANRTEYISSDVQMWVVQYNDTETSALIYHSHKED